LIQIKIGGSAQSNSRAVLALCRPNAPFAELVRLSKTCIADEMREKHRRRVRADYEKPLVGKTRLFIPS
jgi:hypothetical protein